jgi:hypothetical protein
MKSRLATLVLLLALAAAPAFGQGCAMCYSSAKGASAKGQQALSRAVLVLLLPTISLMAGIVGIGYSYSRKRDREKQSS